MTTAEDTIRIRMMSADEVHEIVFLMLTWGQPEYDKGVNHTEWRAWEVDERRAWGRAQRNGLIPCQLSISLEDVIEWLRT